MNTLIRIRTMLTAAVFWIGIVGAVLAGILAELGDYIDNKVVSAIVAWLLPAATVVTVLGAIIRRVSEVIPADRGLLPIAYPTVDRRDGRDAGLSLIETILVVVCVVLALVGLWYLFG